MTKEHIADVYKEISKVLPDNMTTLIGIYYRDGMLLPGISYFSEEDNYEECSVDTKHGTICWSTDKQLSLKGLTKVVRIWNELRHEVC